MTNKKLLTGLLGLALLTQAGCSSLNTVKPQQEERNMDEVFASIDKSHRRIDYSHLALGYQDCLPSSEFLTPDFKERYEKDSFLGRLDGKRFITVSGSSLGNKLNENGNNEFTFPCQSIKFENQVPQVGYGFEIDADKQEVVGQYFNGRKLETGKEDIVINPFDGLLADKNLNQYEKPALTLNYRKY